MPRLTREMLIQQQRPISIGFPPDFTSFTILVLSPIADIAMTIKNFESSLKGEKKELSTPREVQTVVIIEASTKKTMNIGKTFLRLKVLFASDCSFLSFLVRQNARTRVMGIIARVRVSFTIVAVSRVLAPACIPSHAVAAAVTEEVSFIAVPAKRPKPSLVMPSMEPRVGKVRAARTLKRKITEIDWAISSSFASITGAVAAIAEPPQIEEPTPIRVETFAGVFINL